MKLAALMLLDLDADLGRADEIAAGGDGMQAETGAQQHELQDDGDHGRPGEARPHAAADDRREHGAGLRLHREAAGDRQRQAVDHEQRAERGDEGGHVEQDGDGGIDRADAGRRDERDDHRQPHGHAGGIGEEHHERREGVDHADRQVELADDQNHDLAGGDDRRGRGEVDQVADIVGGQELIGGRLKIDDQQESSDDDAHLAPAQEKMSHALPETATRRRLARDARAGRVAIRGWISPHGTSPPHAAIGPVRLSTFSSDELPS